MDTTIEASIRQSCAVISTDTDLVRVRQLAQQYLALDAKIEASSRAELCKALAWHFAMRGLTLTNDGTGPVIQPSTLTQVSDRLWVGTRNGLTYALHRIDKDANAIKFWDGFCRRDQAKAKEYVMAYDSIPEGKRSFKYEKNMTHPEQRFSQHTMGLDSFLQSVALSNRGNYEVWVAFITPERVTGPNDVNESLNVEMFISALTDPYTPMVLHMGIQRSFQYAMKVADPQATLSIHNGLAIPIHSFIARVMIERCPNKVYMISRPVPFMTSLIQKALPFNTFIIPYEDSMNPKYPLQYWWGESVLMGDTQEYHAAESRTIQVLDPLRRHVIFKYTRELDERARRKRSQETEVKDSLVIRGKKWDGFSARSMVNWLFHGDMFDTTLNDVILVDYHALANNF